MLDLLSILLGFAYVKKYLHSVFLTAYFKIYDLKQHLENNTFFYF